MKKTLRIAILFAIVALLFVAPSFAAETIITLNESNPTYTLEGNVEGQIIVESGNVTITGDGTLTCNTGSAIIVRGGSLTINGGNFVSNSTEEYNQSALYVDTNGTATVNAGTTFTGNAKNYAVRVHAGTLTVNGGTIYGANAASVACCGGTLNVNGGSWSSDGTWTVGEVTQADILAACAMESGVQANVVVTGGTFKNFDPTKIYYSTGFGASVKESTGTAIAEGYAYTYDAATGTGTVAKEPCKHTSLSLVNEVPATTEKEGTYAHFVCSCGKIFKDPDAKTELTQLDLVIPKLTDVGNGNVGDNVGNVGGEGSKEEQKDDNDDKKTSSTPAPAPAAPAAAAPAQEKDNTPKTGAISIVAIIAVMSVIGLAVIKRD